MDRLDHRRPLRSGVDELLDFDSDFDIGFERDRVLADAARFLEVDAGALAGGGDGAPSEMAALVRAFSEDQASLERPTIYLVKREALKAAAAAMPVSVRELTERARFYWVSIPVSLFSAVGRGFNRLEVKIAFNPDDEGIRPTAFSILPSRRWATKLKIGAELSAGVTADLKVAVGLPEELAALSGLPVSGTAAAHARGSTGLVLGPFAWSLRCPEVEHNAANLDHVFWRLSGAQFVREQDPGLRILLCVPNAVNRLAITGQLRARRYYNLFDHKLMEAIRTLPETLKSFFTDQGTQILSADRWDLSPEMDVS